ncbi:MAG: ATP-binding protein [Candidatus Methylacidiphilales bacterium]|nr:ATP-binding protein [Candidatus Methylacidiphilales bacterium]
MTLPPSPSSLPGQRDTRDQRDANPGIIDRPHPVTSFSGVFQLPPRPSGKPDPQQAAPAQPARASFGRRLRSLFMQRRIVRFWTSTLSGRLICVMLLAVALSQIVFIVISRTERAYAVRVVLKEECLGRVSSAVRLTQATPATQRPEVLQKIGTPLTRYWLSSMPPGTPQEWQAEARENLLRPVPTAGDNSGVVRGFMDEPMLQKTSTDPWEILPPATWLLHLPVHVLPLQQWNGFGFSVQLPDGTWMNTVFAKPSYLMGANAVTPGYYAALVLTAIIFAGAALFVANRISRPLQHLTKSAERLGRGEQVELLPEEGPDDIRHTVVAFNRMQIRLRRFVEDRTRMLAAVGHDLRTPITSLRLRAEFISDPETREKFLATLTEMQTMTEAALNFARSESAGEQTRVVELNALVESICDDLAEIGWDVKFVREGSDGADSVDGSDGATRLPCACRPDAMRRAIRNIIENAVRYGDRARVSLHASPGVSDGVEIIVEDDGPGVPEAQRENVFTPFLRLETSRNRSTGGVGLGLSIARSIMRGHGGDIYLSHPPARKSASPEGAGPGLRVHLRLPSCDPEHAGIVAAAACPGKK